MEDGKYFYVKHVKCAGCGVRRTYDGEGLRMKFTSNANWKLLLACSIPCAQKFVKPEQKKCESGCKPETQQETEMLMTKNGPIPYRRITQSLE